MKVVLLLLAVTLALTQAATVEKRKAPAASRAGSYEFASAQPSGYSAPTPTNSYSSGQGAAPPFAPPPPAATYSSDPLALPQAAAAQGYSTNQAGYGSPTASYSYSDPSGYTMQQGFEGFMVPSMYGSKWFAVIPWIVVAIGGAVLLPLLLVLPGLLFPFLKLGKLFSKKKLLDKLVKGRFLDENPQLVDVAHNVFTALGKFQALANKKGN